MAEEDSELKKNEFRIGGNTFYDRKNKIPMKIPESKRSEIGIIAEFRGIPNGFPNLGYSLQKTVSAFAVPSHHLFYHKKTNLHILFAKNVSLFSQYADRLTK
jgi:hypothetical protein